MNKRAVIVHDPMHPRQGMLYFIAVGISQIRDPAAPVTNRM